MHPRANAGLAGMEQRHRALVLDRLIEHIGRTVVGEEALHRRVELEALDAELAHQTACLARAHLALGRIDRGERDHDVAILGGDLRHFLVLVAAKARLAFGIDRKDHTADPAFAIIGRRLFHGRQHAFRAGRVLEIFRHSGLKLVIAVIAVAAAGLFRMGVHVEGDQVIKLHEGRSCYCDIAMT